MSDSILVRIIGAPVACRDGVQERWREVADWAAGQLKARYGDSVQVKYFNLFDPDCPALLPDSQLPVVFVGDDLVSSGGKVSIPLIRRKVDELGVKKDVSPTVIASQQGKTL